MIQLKMFYKQSCLIVRIFCWEDNFSIKQVILKLITKHFYEVILDENFAGKIAAGMDCQNLATNIEMLEK